MSRKALLFAAALPVALLAVPPAPAQENDRDPGFLAGLIEEQLDAPGLDVEIDGFEGALSSRASVEEIRVADDEGVWLTLRDVVLDWNRSALLRGRLEVEELTAALIDLDRLPLPSEDAVEAPPAAAQGFRLPNLPVSIALDRLAAERIEVGAPVLGQDAAFTLEAAARLADGSGSASLEAVRLDGPEGVFDLAASYDGETQVLAIDLDAQEAEGGIVVTLANIPDAPALDLDVQGQGPLDAFAAELALATAGEPRVTGAVTLEGTPEGRRFDVSLDGDVAPLLAPQYRDFFGDGVTVAAAGLQRAEGGFALDRLAVETQALSLAGEVAVGADGWPEVLDIEGRLASPDGGPVVLPVGGEVTVGAVDLRLAYDPTASDGFDLTLEVDALEAGTTGLGEATLTARGTVRRDGGAVTGLTGSLEGVVDGLSFDDPAVAQAVGSEVTLTSGIDWDRGSPLRLDGIGLDGMGYGLSGDAAVDVGAAPPADVDADEAVEPAPVAGGLPITLDLAAAFDDLAALAPLVGLDLAGSASAQVSGTVAPLAGTFDVDLGARTDGLALGIEQADAVLDGTTTLAVAARRTDEGTFLEGLTLENEQVEADASFTIYGEGTPAREAGRTGAATLSARLADGVVIDPRLAGPVTLEADVTQADDGTWSGEVAAAGPEGLSVTADGQLTGPEPDVAFAAAAPDLSAFVEGVPEGVELQGRAFARDGVWSVEADALGPWGVAARVEGPVTGDAPRIAFEAAVPDTSDPVPALSAVPPLDGRATLEGVLAQTDGVWRVDAEAATEAGVTARASGPVAGAPITLDFAADVPNLADFADALDAVPPLDAPATLSGTLAQTDEAFTIDARAETETGIVVEAQGPITGEDAPDLAVAARVPNLAALSPAVEGIEPLRSAATLDGTVSLADGVVVDLRAVTDTGIAAQVEGPVTGEAADVSFALDVPDLAAFSPALEGVPPLNGPAALAGTAARDGEAWVLDAGLSTDGGVRATVTGPVTGPAPAVDFRFEVPDASDLNAALAEVGPLEGAAVLEGAAAQAEGVWSVDVGLAVEGGLRAAVEGPVTGDAARVAFELSLPDLADVTPALNEVEALRGEADLSGTAAREGGVWVLDVALRTAAGISADVEGPLGGDGARVTFDARVPQLEAFAPVLGDVPPLTGGAALEGSAAQQDGAWVLDVDLATDSGIAARVDGAVTGDAPRVTFEAVVPDLQAFSPALAEVEPLAGAATLDGVAQQDDGVWSVDVDIAAEGGATVSVDGPVTGADARIAFEASVPDLSSLSPALTEIEPLQTPATLAGVLAREGEAFVLDADVDTRTGIAVTASGPVTGPSPRIAFEARVPDVLAFAPQLDGAPLRGPATLTGTLARPAEDWRIAARVDGPAGIVVRADGRLTGEGAPELDVAATVRDLAPFDDLVPGVTLEGALSLDAAVAQTPAGLTVDARASGPFGARVTARTVLDEGPLSADFTAVVPELSAIVPAVPGGLDVAGAVSQTEAGLRVEVAGTGPYDLVAEVDALLAEEGPIVAATGRVPDAGAIAPQLEGPLSFDAEARQVEGDWIVDVDAEGAGGLTLSAAGTATGENADLDVSLTAADVARFAPGLSGGLTAEARLFAEDGGYAFELDASGPLGASLDASGQLTGRAPEAQFDLRVPDIAPLVPDLSGPLNAQGTARQEGERWSVDIDLQGPGGTTAAVSGLAGAQSDLSVTGQAPLGLANAFIEPQRAAGTARFDLALNGAPGLDALTGTVTTTGAAVVLPTLNNGLENIDATINLQGGRAVLDVSAGVETGGTVAVSGPVSLSAPFDANLSARFDVVAADPDLYTADVRGALSITGPLTGGALIAGDVLIDGAEIAVPSSGLTAVGDVPPITHVNTPAPVRRTLDRAGLDPAAMAEAAAGADGGGGGLRLDLTVTADRLFVRGRGLDAELGGRIFVDGTTANPIVSGGIDLVRGRLDVLQQRFQLDEGSVTFQGGLTPFIRLVAITETDALTASIIVEGPATEPEVRFESTPEVPQEEILAQIFFGRDLTSLSPLQAVQLANSVATLAGRGSGGLLDRLRGSAGLDDLDITTDDEGNAAVRAGTYVSENVYTDVQVGSEGDARVSLNVDITPNLTVRGEAGAQGDTSIGLFFERDY